MSTPSLSPADTSPPSANKRPSALKAFLYPLYCAITGKGGSFLKHKQEVHRRRAVAERGVLAEAQRDPSLFRENACPACGERHLPRKEFSNPIGFQFAVCPTDGTVYMDPIPTDATLTRMYNDPAESYLWLRDDAAESVQVNATDDADYQALLRWLPGESRGKKLLDVGCATGGFLMTARRTFDVHGCELNDSTAATARAQGLDVRTGSVGSVPGEAQYDVITMLQVIEHLPIPADSLREVTRLLKPGGYYYLNTPNIDSLSFHFLGNRHTHVSSFGHVSLFNEKSLKLLGSRCGMELVAYEDCGGRDLALHDWLSFKVNRPGFVHRMSAYSPRLYYAANFVEKLTGPVFRTLISPKGNQSYHRALFRKPLP